MLINVDTMRDRFWLYEVLVSVITVVRVLTLEMSIVKCSLIQITSVLEKSLYGTLRAKTSNNFNQFHSIVLHHRISNKMVKLQDKELMKNKTITN